MIRKNIHASCYFFENDTLYDGLSESIKRKKPSGGMAFLLRSRRDSNPKPSDP